MTVEGTKRNSGFVPAESEEKGKKKASQFAAASLSSPEAGDAEKAQNTNQTSSTMAAFMESTGVAPPSRNKRDTIDRTDPDDVELTVGYDNSGQPYYVIGALSDE